MVKPYALKFIHCRKYGLFCGCGIEMLQQRHIFAELRNRTILLKFGNKAVFRNKSTVSEIFFTYSGIHECCKLGICTRMSTPLWLRSHAQKNVSNVYIIFFHAQNDETGLRLPFCLFDFLSRWRRWRLPEVVSERILPRESSVQKSIEQDNSNNAICKKKQCPAINR